LSEAVLAPPKLGAPRALLQLLPDEQLARRAAHGSTQAFAAIYRRHYQELYRYCRSIVGNEEDARDALQNTMLKAMRALDGERREIALRAWLFKIAHNEAISMLRLRPADAPLDAAAELAAADADHDSRQRLRYLIGDLGQLPARQRGALVMRELSGLGFDEIAVALDTTPGAAKQAVYEARLALHDYEAGREMACEEIRRKISANDRRLLRGRALKAHLGDCAECRRFQQATSGRRVQLAAIAPPLPAPAAAAVFDHVLGAGGGGAAIGAGIAFGLGSGGAAKLGVASLVALGAGGLAAQDGGLGRAHVERPAAVERPAPAAEEAAGSTSTPPASASAGNAAAATAAAKREREGAGDAERRSARGDARDETEAAGGSGAAGASATSAAPGAGAPAPEAVRTAESSVTPDPGNSSNLQVPARAPAGHGGAPPPFSDDPPAASGSAPGLSENPPPGQGGVTPGQTDVAPGQAEGSPSDGAPGHG
jgi:RNA polymerase sigma factor (sigma-70 family)